MVFNDSSADLARFILWRALWFPVCGCHFAQGLWPDHSLCECYSFAAQSKQLLSVHWLQFAPHYPWLIVISSLIGWHFHSGGWKKKKRKTGWKRVGLSREWNTRPIFSFRIYLVWKVHEWKCFCPNSFESSVKTGMILLKIFILKYVDQQRLFPQTLLSQVKSSKTNSAWSSFPADRPCGLFSVWKENWLGQESSRPSSSIMFSFSAAD